MNVWIDESHQWLISQYKSVLGSDTNLPNFRWLQANSLIDQTERTKAEGMVVEDGEIGWLMFFLPYSKNSMERQVSESLSVRSRLLTESNYTGLGEAGEREDPDSAWRVGITWLVSDEAWPVWQRQVLELRRESGAAEEVSLDAVRIFTSVTEALALHGCPRLLLNTRALLKRSSAQAVSWLTADEEVAAELQDFVRRFHSSRSRGFARELEKYASDFSPSKSRELPHEPRKLERFRVKHFRNLEALEIATDVKSPSSQAIILFGPNGTGKSTLAEALSLAAFGTSPRLERFLSDRDVKRRTIQDYEMNYLAPFGTNLIPSYSWNRLNEASFQLYQSGESFHPYDGIVLNQEDSLKFTEMSRGELAAVVVRGYSELADHLYLWIAHEERQAKDRKSIFTKKHGLNSSISISETAYDRLAQRLLRDQLKRPSPEFLSWLDFLARLSDETGNRAEQLVSAWRAQQADVVAVLANTLAKLRVSSNSESVIAEEIKEKLESFDSLVARSEAFRRIVDDRVADLRDQLDQSLEAIEVWGAWLASKKSQTKARTLTKAKQLLVEADELAKSRAALEKRGKLLRGRSELLEQVQQFLTDHWSKDHPNTCPTCNSDVSDRNGIQTTVEALKTETNETLQNVRLEYANLQNQQKDLAARLQSAGDEAPPIGIDEQARLIAWLTPFLQKGLSLQESLSEPENRRLLKDDLSRMKVLPKAPSPYADSKAESERLARDFVRLAEDADQALEGPQAIAEVKRTLEQCLEKVLSEHLPATIGRVWKEIIITLTTAPWLLPALPDLKVELRGKALSVHLENTDLLIRYIYNAAERHVLGLSWFFTYYLARRRFEEGWMLLDDPAQEMDQPSFRELLRFLETLLRLARRKSQPLTLILGLHQEERALDAARASSGRMYVLGWQTKQDDSKDQSTIKKVVLLAPGFHPLKPEVMLK